MLTDEQITRLSKTLAYYLRHHPDQLGLTLGPGGWVAVDALLAGLARAGKPMTAEALAEVVARNSKRRYALSPDGGRIRASQGHSVAVDLGLTPAEPPAQLYHGTSPAALPAIWREGLRAMGRHHVHLSADVETARAVGARRGRPAVLLVDAAGMRAAGHQLYLSENGVWLADAVPPAFLSALG